MLPSSWYKSKRGRSYFAVFQSNFQSSFWSSDIWKREKSTELKVEVISVEVVSCILVSEPLSTCLKLEWESELTKSEGKEGGRCGIFSILVSQTLSTCFSFQPCYIFFFWSLCYIYGDVFKWWNLLYFQVILSSDQTCYVAMNISFQVDYPLSFFLIVHFQESFNYANWAAYCSLTCFMSKLELLL